VIILGLTGSIGMGKSTVSGMFQTLGIPVHDADAVVHDLYRSEAVPLVEAAFPNVTGPNGVDRQKLGARVIGDEAAMKRLEAIIHPLVKARQIAFLAKARADNADIVVLDIPLLLELDRASDCDLVVVVSAKPDQQKARVLARPGITVERFNAVLARQMPDAEKRAQADIVIDNSGTLAETEAQVEALVVRLRQKGSL
jgi:dephospho-CoA kinase